MSEGRSEFIGRVVLGRYRIVHSLAKGGMGVIYLARSEGAAGFAKPVVVKQILSQFVGDDSVIHMFKREARIMSNMRHPGVVSVLDFGQEENAYLMVLEYVHGFHAGRWRRYVQSRGENFSAEFAVHIVINVLDALHYAHTLVGADGKALRIIHRDVSPSNVLIDVDGHVKLADFGIARMQNEQTEWKTGEATVKGKLPYLAPELFRGQEPSPQTDVYAAGVVLHEMISGRNEFRAEDPSQTVGRVLQHRAERLDDLRDDVSRELAEVVQKALAKKREDRYQSAAEFAQALRSARRLSGDEALTALAEACRRDFLDPAMAAALGCDELTALEQAWREPHVPDADGVMELLPQDAMDEPADGSLDGSLTHADDGASQTIAEQLEGVSVRPPPRRSRSIWLWSAGVFLLGAAVAGAVLVLVILPHLKPPPPIVIGGDETGHGGQGTGTEIPTAPGPTTPSNVVATTDVAPSPTALTTLAAVPEEQADAGAAASAVNTLTPESGPTIHLPHVTPRTNPSVHTQMSTAEFARPFQNRTDEVRRCVTQHVRDFEGAPEIRVRFSLDESGTVRAANLVPDELSPTPFGQCVLNIARSTHWPHMPAPITFSIPVRVHRTE